MLIAKKGGYSYREEPDNKTPPWDRKKEGKNPRRKRNGAQLRELLTKYLEEVINGS